MMSTYLKLFQRGKHEEFAKKIGGMHQNMLDLIRCEHNVVIG